MRIKCLGNASFEIETEGSILHIDPHVVPGVVGKADIILITHDHLDHADEEGIFNVKKKDTLVISTDRTAQKLGLSCRIVHIGELLIYENILVKAVPAYVGGSEQHKRGHGVGYVIESEGKRVYHAGVTKHVPEMSLVDEVNVMLLPLGKHNNLSVDEIIKITQTVNPEILAPVYYRQSAALTQEIARIKMMVESSSHTMVEDLILTELHV